MTTEPRRGDRSSLRRLALQMVVQNLRVAPSVSNLEVTSGMLTSRGLLVVPNERTPDGDTLKKEWRWWGAKALGVWAMYALWIAYKFSSRGIVMDARAWSGALGVGFLTIVVQTSISLMILRDPPESLSRRLLSLVGAIVLAALTLVTWVMMPGWLEPMP